MTTIATLAVKLIADAAGFIAAMDSAEKKTQTWSQNVSNNMKNVGGNISSFGQKATGYLTLPLVAGGLAALNYASDLEETKNKANVVFGSMADDVMKWSSTSDTALGMSQQKALDAISTFGAMGDSAGMNATDNLKWSKSLVQLGSDWSSFYNLDPVDSLNAIQSAVAGQYEPLRRMGIVINQASLEQKALQMGLMEQGGTLSDSARYQALYALMVEKSSAAQGDFARTADGVANQTRIVRAQYENAAATLGQQLLPYATQLLTWISQAIAWFQALTPEQQKWVVGFAAIIAIAGPLLMVIGGLITAIGTIVGVVGAISAPIWIVIAVIAALIAIGYLLYQAWINNWGGIQEKTAAVLAFIQGLIQMGLQFIEDLTTGKLGALSQIWNNTFLFIQTYIQNFIIFWQAIFAAFAAAANGDWYAFGENMRVAFDTMLNTIGALIQTSWANISTAVSALVTNVIEFFKTVDWGAVGTSIVQGIANGITAAVGFIRQAAQSAAQAALDAAKGFLGIKSPARRPRKEVGYPIGQGQGLGWIDGLTSMIPAVQNSVDNMMRMAMPSVMPAVPELSAAGVGVPAVNQSLRNGGTKMIVVPVTYEDHSLINVNKEYEAKAKLREIVNDINRENENK